MSTLTSLTMDHGLCAVIISVNAIIYGGSPEMQAAPYPFQKAGMVNIVPIFVTILLYSSGGLKNCVPGPMPGSTYVNCTYQSITVQHGRIESTPWPLCLGLYCWNGTLTPIGCPSPKPKPVQMYEYTDVPHNGSWPLCCYYQRECNYLWWKP
uniref:8.9 kDa family member n=1 Tax=Rhipicephalus zambeziensis TaxID=60191 RepID=A0A224YAR1_9ACAR